MNTNFSHEQSLALINEMICRARNNVQKERMYSVLFWGYTVAFLAFTNFVLIHTLNNPNHSYLVWLAIFPAWLCMILGFVVPGHLLNRPQKQNNV